MTVLAITGATGFLGGAVLAQALADGRAVRALTRRAMPDRAGVTWIGGDLADHDALARLVDGADAVVHIAGVVRAPDRAGFAAGNVDGTAAMLRAAQAAGVARFVHVSSLSAREPQLSAYGWSKAEGEALVRASPLDWSVVRPPAIYGPGDLEMLDLFRVAARGIVPLPPAGRLSAIHVDDLARLLLVLADRRGDCGVYEADDGTPGGWTHAGFARAIGVAVGRERVLPLSLPGGLLAVAARADRWLRGDAAKLTPDRVGYLVHPDWTIDPARRPPAAWWTPRIATPAGLAETAMWYRAQGLL